jgi:hypothetical protein
VISEQELWDRAYAASNEARDLIALGKINPEYGKAKLQKTMKALSVASTAVNELECRQRTGPAREGE